MVNSANVGDTVKDLPAVDHFACSEVHQSCNWAQEMTKNQEDRKDMDRCQSSDQEPCHFRPKNRRVFPRYGDRVMDHSKDILHYQREHMDFDYKKGVLGSREQMED